MTVGLLWWTLDYLFDPGVVGRPDSDAPRWPIGLFAAIPCPLLSARLVCRLSPLQQWLGITVLTSLVVFAAPVDLSGVPPPPAFRTVALLDALLLAGIATAAFVPPSRLLLRTLASCVGVYLLLPLLC